MQHVHGEMGQHYNMKKEREGSFWSNRFHSTWVETGVHLQRCLFYIDMNMVRANVVDHPAKWKHSSAYELASSRQRYRIVDRQRLVERLGLPGWDAYRNWYDASLRDVLARGLFTERQAFWTDSPAVGCAAWVEDVAARSGMKRYSTVETGLDWPETLTSVFLTRNRHA